MKAKRPFLTARWINLGMISYAIDPALLDPYMPPDCEPDMLEGRAFVSVVAFDFVDTRVLGIKWPGFVSFPEINLRFYVRHRGERGVCFIRELVPQRLVAWMAKLTYNEPYVATPMTSRVERTDRAFAIHHQVRFRNAAYSINVTGDLPAITPDESSLDHFFKEQSWGFGRSRGGKLITYRVDHPRWQIYPNARCDLNWDFGRLYGDRWKFLNDAKPFHVALVEGSAVTVSPKKSVG